MFSESFTGEKPPETVGRKVHVVWHDACSFANEWVGLEAIDQMQLQQCETRGFLVRETEDALHIAQSRHTDGEYHNIFVIPRHSVVSIDYED